ncbi:MAG: hypothetical protein ACFFE4_19595 [Candidatus Thorarchaeota archaeon]
MAVYVAATNDGQIVHDSNSEADVAWLRVTETTYVLENGWFRPSNRSALLRGPSEYIHTKFGSFKDGDKIEGFKIVIRETTDNMVDDPGYSPKVMPANPKLGRENDLYLLKDGKHIWRTQVVVPDSEEYEDQVIAYTGTTAKPKFEVSEPSTEAPEKELEDSETFA